MGSASLLTLWIVVPLATLVIFWGLGWLVVGRTFTAHKSPGLVLGCGFGALIVLLNGLALVPVVTPTLLLLVALVVAAGWLWFARDLAQRFSKNSVLNWLQFQRTAVVVLSVVVAGLPVLVSGKPGWIGWVKLDDGASWLAFADWIVRNGRVLPTDMVSGLDRLIESNLSFNESPHLGEYPTGMFGPLGIVAAISGMDSAWVLQPFMATIAGVLALMLFDALNSIFKTPLVPLVGATIAAQASTYIGYAWWGGLKEVSIPPIVLTTALLASAALSSDARATHRIANLVGAGLSSGALLSIGGSSSLGYLLPIVLAVLLLGMASTFPSLSKWLGLSVISGGLTFLFLLLVGINPIDRLVQPIPDMGNLIRPLEFWQIAGIWIGPDFRLDPIQPASGLLIGLTAVLATIGAYWLVRIRKWGLLTWAASSILIGLYGWWLSSAWLAGKALAVASPAFLTLAFVGVGAIARLQTTPTSVVAAISGGLVILGVLWSNSLQYSQVWMAPFDQQSELSRIGNEFSGLGPALLVEYSVYGSRHFLSSMRAESASELRVSPVELRDGTMLNKGEAADISSFSPRALDKYQALVLRRTPSFSRPPWPFSLAWTGAWFEVWVRDEARSQPLKDISLGTWWNPVGLPDCSQVEQLAALQPDANLVAYDRDPVLVSSLQNAKLPEGWISTGDAVVPGESGTAVLDLEIPEDGNYEFWLAGTWPGVLTIEIDQTRLSESRSVIEGNAQLANPVGRKFLTAGIHDVRITHERPWWLPGAQLRGFTLGPLIVSKSGPGDAKPVAVQASEYRVLCGREWDLIELIPK